MKRRIKKNHALHNARPVIIDIVDLSRGGAGFGRDENGRAVFVPYTMPGDQVKVKITKAKSKFAEGYALEILKPSEQRIEAKCEVFGRCGGCQWQHIPYSQQWQTKKQGVLNALSLNKTNITCNIDEFPAEHPWHYRNRVQLRGNINEIGFFESLSNKIVNIQHCPITHPTINTEIPVLLEQGKQFRKPYKVEVNLTVDGKVEAIWNDEHASSGFRQVNDEQNEKLKNWINEHIPDDIPVLDLYGGSGNLSKPFMSDVPEIHCVDLSVPDNSLAPAKHFHFHKSSVASWLEKQVSSKSIETNEWTALLDPPRDALAKDGEAIVSALKKLKVNTIIFVGCKTDPWSRDLSIMIKQGWKLKHLAVFDFFPQTYHVESAAVLTR